MPLSLSGIYAEHSWEVVIIGPCNYKQAKDDRLPIFDNTNNVILGSLAVISTGCSIFQSFC